MLVKPFLGRRLNSISGIGFTTALLLAGQGVHLSLADLNEKQLLEAVDKIKGTASSTNKIIHFAVDVRKDDQVNDWIAKTVEQLGKLDGAVNLAGVIPKSINKERVEDLNNDDWHFVLDVNLNGVMYCMRAQLQNMNNNGSIINAASKQSKPMNLAITFPDYRDYRNRHLWDYRFQDERSVYRF